MTDKIRQTIGLPPDDTLRFFRAKDYLSAEYRENWDAIWQAEHGRWFTVTKVFNGEVLEDIRRSLDKNFEEGGSYADWKRDLLAKLRDKDGVDPRLLTSASRLRVVYDTNLRVSRAAGQWKRIQASTTSPFLMYSAVNDGNTRPLHRVWGGLDTGKPVILHKDHPWWDTHFPPCGWNCRCGVVQLSAREMKRRGLQEYEPPEQPPSRYVRSTGEVVSVPAGIDPGFAYNPGKAHLAALDQPPASGPLQVPHISPEPLPSLPPPRPVSSSELIDPEAVDQRGAIDHFLRTFGEPDANGNVAALDVLNEPVLLNGSFFYRGGQKGGTETEKLVDSGRIRFMPLFARTIAEPDEVWWVWEKQKQRDGSPGPARLTRRYVARFSIDGTIRDIVIAMALGPGGWRGVTAFANSRRNYLDKPQVRGGVLGYRRS